MVESENSEALSGSPGMGGVAAQRMTSPLLGKVEPYRTADGRAASEEMSKPEGSGGSEGGVPNGFSIAALQEKENGVDEGDPEVVWVLGFNVGDRQFAVGVENTEGVVDCPRLSPLPSAPEMVVGVGSVRGRITLAVDLSMEPAECGKRRLILLRGDAQLGLLADHVAGVIPLKPKELREFTESWLRRRGRAEASLRQAAGKIARSYFKRDGRAVPVVDLEMVSSL